MKNDLATEQLIYTGTKKNPTQIELYQYSADRVFSTIESNFQAIHPLLNQGNMDWLHISGLSDTHCVAQICNQYQIDRLIIEDILNTRHPSKIEEYDNYVVFISRLFKNDEAGNLMQQQITIILGKNYLLTFLESDAPFFDNVQQAIKNNVYKIREKSSDYLFSVLLNNIMSNYATILTPIWLTLEDMETQLFSESIDKDFGFQILTFRKRYMRIKKAVLPIKEQFGSMFRYQNGLILPENRDYFNDVNDHLQNVSQTLEMCREMLSSLVDLYLSMNDSKMNNIMKRLTTVSTIFIPLTFMVGVWGMNFENMPELSWKYGYIVAWSVMLATGGGVFYVLKKKKYY